MADALPERATWEQLLAHGEFLRRLARALVHDESRAEDVVQATWLAAAAHPPRATAALGGWLRRVATNVARQWQRSDGRRIAREQRAAPPESQPSTLAEAATQLELQQRVLAAVDALEPKYRAVVVLHFLEGLRVASIAAKLDLPAATVRTQLHRALAQLRERLDAAHGGDRERWQRGLVLLGAEAASEAALGGAVVSIVATLLLLVGGSWWWVALAEPADAEQQAALAAAAAAAPLPDDVRAIADAVAESSTATQRAPVAGLILPTVSGRVIDALGAPVGGATVVLEEGATASATGRATASVTQSASDGSFAFSLDDARSGSLRCRASLAGAVGSEEWLFLDGHRRAARGVTLQLHPARDVRGAVRSLDGAPIAGAWLVVRCASSVDLAPLEAETAADGGFALSLPLCAVELDVAALGFAPRRFGPIGPEESEAVIELEPVEPTRLELALPPDVATSGHALSLSLHPGPLRREPFGAQPMPRVLPKRWQRLAGEELLGGPLLGLPAGRLDGTFSCDGWPLTSKPITIELKGGAATTLAWPDGVGGATLRGALRDGGGAPLAGRAIAIAPRRWVRPLQVTTAADGSFALPLPTLVTEPLRLWLVDPALALVGPTTFGGVAWCEPPRGGAEPEVALQAVPSASWRGRIVALDGAPQAGVRVELDLPASEPLRSVPSITTDLDGTFELRGLPPSDVELGLRVVPRFAEEPLALAERRAIPVGASLDSGTHLLPAPASLSGRVVDAEGRGVAGARVERVSQSVRQGAISDRDGRFALFDLPAGMVTLRIGDRALAVGSLPPLTGFALEAGERREGVELRHGDPSSESLVRGRIVFEEQWIAPSVAVLRLQIDGGVDTQYCYADDPTFAVEVAQPTSRVRATTLLQDSDGSTIVVGLAAPQTAVPGGAPIEVVVRKPARTRVEAQIVEAHGAPVTRSLVWLIFGEEASSPYDHLSAGCLTAGDGRFALRGLPVGTYRLQLGSDPHLPEAVREFTLRDGDEVALGEIRLAKAPVLTGTLVDRDGAPIVGGEVGNPMRTDGFVFFPGGVVGCRNRNDPLNRDWPYAATDAQGRYVLDDPDLMPQIATAPGFAPREIVRNSDNNDSEPLCLLPAGDFELANLPEEMARSGVWRMRLVSLETADARRGYPDRTTTTAIRPRTEEPCGFFALPVGAYRLHLWKGDSGSTDSREVAPDQTVARESFVVAVTIRAQETALVDVGALW
ncbi:MAG: sigma-70 family RNA polymerase sigma factor [Planctomycetes bacterium]|nr:sigma-70 family RNA polymerase sigma factor [Planctomycetota bacterium]